MKIERKVFFLSVGFGLLVWVIDAVLDSLIFFEGTFWDMLILDISKHEVYMRSFILASFIILGIIISSITAKRKRAEESLKHLSLVLRAIRKVNQLLIRESDRKRLINGACENLVETRGYYNAWIALLYESGNLEMAAEAGIGDDAFQPMLERLKSGDLTICGKKALEQPDVFVVDDPPSYCADCPLAVKYHGRAGMSVRLEYEGEVYGLMTVSIPPQAFRDKEEQSLFKEVADDIAFGLFGIEIQEKREMAEISLRESEERYRELFENESDAVIVFDAETLRLEDGNKAALDLYGYSREEFLSLTLVDISSEEEEAREVIQKIEDAVDNAKSVHLLSHKKKDGSLFPCEVYSGKFLSGGRKKIIGAVRDISERLRFQEQIQQSQKMEAIGTLAGGVAHDFNNLLTTIMGNADLMLAESNKHNPLRKRIIEIRAAGKRSASLTWQLLAFSRKQMVQPKVLEFNEILEGMEEMLIRLLGEDVELETIQCSDSCRVEADPGQLEQVIMNLAVNARDAMPRGGKLIFETDNVYLDQDYFRAHGVEGKPGLYVMLTVSDTGEGMDRETQSRVFEPFFTTKREGRGTGLGLSTAFGIVKQAEGYIWPYSKPGKGTTFKVYLPKVDKQIPSLKKKEVSMEKLRGSETVLVVEDDEAVRKLIETVLQRYGYNTLVAEDGEEALLRLSEAHAGSIHLLLIDVVMPNMSGRDVAELFQQFRQEIEVIYMSGYTYDTITRHGVLLPEVNFLAKPFSPQNLLRKVREVLDQNEH